MVLSLEATIMLIITEQGKGYKCTYVYIYLNEQIYTIIVGFLRGSITFIMDTRIIINIMLLQNLV